MDNMQNDFYLMDDKEDFSYKMSNIENYEVNFLLSEKHDV